MSKFKKGDKVLVEKVIDHRCEPQINPDGTPLREFLGRPV